jgi:hypothetical protein
MESARQQHRGERRRFALVLHGSTSGCLLATRRVAVARAGSCPRRPVATSLPHRYCWLFDVITDAKRHSLWILVPLERLNGLRSVVQQSLFMPPRTLLTALADYSRKYYECPLPHTGGRCSSLPFVLYSCPGLSTRQPKRRQKAKGYCCSSIRKVCTEMIERPPRLRLIPS